MNHKKYAFTLVELLVVISLLAFLATFSYLYFTNNIAESRDSRRLTDLKEITNVLEIHLTENGALPDPSDAVDVTFSGGLAWKQGTFGKSLAPIIRVFGNDIPTDPKFKNEYTYSITNKSREFQIAGIYEVIDEEKGLGELAQNVIPQTYAASVEAAMVLGSYNGVMVKVEAPDKEYYIASPSIISNDISDTDAISIITNQKLVYNEFFNIAHSYRPFMNVEGGFDFNVNDPIIFSGSSDDLKSESKLLDFNSQLKYIYATTPTESFDRYIALLNEDTLTNLKDFLTKRFKIPFRSYFNCKDILDDGASTGDGNYVIDPDGENIGESPYTVYCDMSTDGGGWTRVGQNQLVNGNFSGGNGVVGAIENTDENHQIIPLTSQIDDNFYTLHQTGNYSSHYKIPLPDISLLKPGYEIRMTQWRLDSSTGSTTNDTKVLAGKTNYWTLGTCTTDPVATSCRFSYFNKKMNNAANFGTGGILTKIPISLVPPTNTLTTNYLNGGVLFSGYFPQGQARSSSLGTIQPMALAEIQAIDSWVQAGGFFISLNDEENWDPTGEYFGIPSAPLWQNVSDTWQIQNIDHPIVNGSIGMKVDLRGKTLIAEQSYSHLKPEFVLASDVVLARDRNPPYHPTVVLRKHGKGMILFTSDEGVFRNMSSGTTFLAGDNEDAFAAAIMAYAIETAAGINPHEGYTFHNRIHYSDGTFSTNGEDEILETRVVDGKTWVKERVRHKVYKTPESFDWYIGLDANNNKDFYYTGLKLEIFYR